MERASQSHIGSLYEVLPSFVLGFHGCDASVADKVFAGNSRLRKSENDYDWLGHGIYFWENNPQRALEYAHSIRDRPERTVGTVKSPAVVGAVIDLGRCLNLLDSSGINIVKDGYRHLKATMKESGEPLPKNRVPAGETEYLLRHLDCAVIEFVHTIRRSQDAPRFDSVRGVFVEGKPVYKGAGFHDKSHLQICVRSRRCIKGYFRVISDSIPSQVVRKRLAKTRIA